MGMSIAKEWARSISEMNAEKQTSFYSYNAVLLPTFDTIELGVDSIYWYFIEFLNKTNLQCEITFINTHLSGNVECSTGLYVFSFIEDDRIKEVEARFTFVSTDGKIISHHSSLNPK
jgi:hypothetical protein